MKEDAPASGVPEEEEVAALVRQLHETQQRLRTLTGGEVDAVMHPAGNSYLLHAAQEDLRVSEAAQREFAATQMAILDALPAHIALVDEKGVIVSVNRAWRRFASANTSQHSSDFGVGQSYLEICLQAAGPCSEEAAAAADGLRRVLGGKVSEFCLEYPCHSPAEKRWFQLLITPLRDDRRAGAVVMHVNVTERKLAEEELRESEARFRGTFEQAAVGIAHVSLTGHFLRVNDRFCDLVSYERPELLTMTFEDLTLPDDWEAGRRAGRSMLAGETNSYRVEKRYRKKGGELIWTSLITTLDRTPEGKPKYFISVFEDIGARKLAQFRLQRLNRLHAVLSKVSEAIVRSTGRHDLYQQVCRIVVEEGQLRMAFIAESDPETGLVRPAASFGEGQDYLKEVTISIDGGPLSQGTAGTALRTGLHDFSNDFAHDPRMQPWRDSAQRYGFGSTASFPLKLGEVTVGALVIFAAEAGYFQDDEIRMMVAVADSLSFAMEALQKESRRQAAEAALRASEAGMSAAQQIAHFGSWEIEVTDPANLDAGPLRWSDEMFRIAGFEPGAVEVSSPFFFSIVPPEEHELIARALAEAVEERRTYSTVHRLRRPDGTERIVRETAEPYFDENTGRLAKLIGTAHDITEQRQAQNELRTQAHMLDQIGQAVISTDTGGRIIYANRFAGELYGWPPAEMLGRNIMEITVPQASLEQAREIMAKLALGESWSGEFQVQDRSGYSFPALVTDSPLLDDQGHLVGIIGISADISERKRAEEAAQRNEQQQRALAEELEAAQAVAKVGSWETDCETMEVRWSAETYRIFEMAETEAPITHANFLALVHPDDREAVGAAFLRSFPQVLPSALEHRLLLPGGRVKFVEERWKILHNLTGKPLRALGTCQDITERRTAEEERDRLFNLSLDMLCIGNFDGWLEQVNPAWTACLGFTAKELTSRPWVEFIHPEDRASTAEVGVRLMNGESVRDFRNRYLRADDSWCCLSWNAHPLVESRKIFAVARDVTKLIEADQRMLEQAALIDQARDAIFVRDMDDRIVFWNKGAEQLYGWTTEEVAGRRFDELLQPDPARLIEADDAIQERGNWSGEMQKVTKAGARVVVDCRWTLLHDGENRPKSFLHIDSDITERRKLEQQFLRAQRMEGIGTLAGGIAHDLNNALGPIMMSLELLSMRFTDPESQELLSIIAGSARRGADMVKQVLSFARGVDGQRVEVNLRTLLAEIEKIVTETFFKSIQVRTIIRPDLWTVAGDPTQLHQVLLNLCVNARDAMPEGGVLTLSAENVTIDAHYAAMNPEAKQGPCVILGVEDSGTGMPAGNDGEDLRSLLHHQRGGERHGARTLHLSGDREEPWRIFARVQRARPRDQI